MDRRERANDQQEALRALLDGRQAQIWTALPGIIQSFNAAAMTCVVQPSVKAKWRKPDGTQTDLALPLLLDCPVQFPSGGGYSLTFPIAQGDECLVVFASRCIDAWWQSGGIQPQAELRMHDLSDGFVLPGIRSKPRALSGISASTAQLRSDDGNTFIDLAAGRVLIQGDLHVTGAVIGGYGGGDQVNLQTHKHPTAATGAPSSPTPGT